MTYFALAEETIKHWQTKGDISPMEIWHSLTGELRIKATWQDVSNYMVGWQMGQTRENRKAA